MRVVADTQWSVVRPTIATLSTPSARSRCSRSVPMNALFALLVSTGSPSRGRASGFTCTLSLPGANRPSLS